MIICILCGIGVLILMVNEMVMKNKIFSFYKNKKDIARKDMS